jgi:hypothetical protein
MALAEQGITHAAPTPRNSMWFGAQLSFSARVCSSSSVAMLA